MIRRIVLVGMLLGLAASGCYDVPRPACGFFCGTGGACPDDYTCNQADNRCHLNGSIAQTCATHDAGPVDTPIDAFTIDGNVAPTITNLMPTPNATMVAVNTEISAVLSEDVTNVNSTTVTLLRGGNPVAGTVFYSAAADVLTFTPTVQLAASTAYTVQIGSGITDLQGAPLTAVSWSFVTGADTVAPFVSLQTPTPGITGVPVGTTVTAMFSEDVINVSATTFTLAAGATPISGTVTYGAATRTAIFTPASALPDSTQITATLTTGITDAAGNGLLSAPVIWTFTTAADAVAPTVTIHSPANGASGIPIGSLVKATFSERVVNATTTTFTVSTSAGPVAGSVAYDIPSRTATFTPNASLPYDTDVTAHLTNAITDVAGNPLAADMWTFHTAPDVIAPMVIAKGPTNNSAPVTTSVTARFDEAVLHVDGTTFTLAAGATPVAGAVSYDPVNHIAAFVPTVNLAYSTLYTATVTSGVTDLAGNPLSGAPVTWTFTTAAAPADTTPPTVQSRTPAAGAMMVATSTTIAVTFSEPVMGVTTSSFVVDDGSGPVAGSLVSSGGGQTWTFTPSASLGAAATVSVTLSSAIADLASNPLASTMYTFTTQ